MVGVRDVASGIGGVVEKEEEEEEELLLLAKVLVKGVMEGVSISPATFCLFDPLFRAPMFHPRTMLPPPQRHEGHVEWDHWDGGQQNGRPYCTTKLWLCTRGNSPVGWCRGWPWLLLTFGSKRLPMAATTMWPHVDRDCNGKRIVHSSRAPQKPQILAHDRAACRLMW